MTNNKENLINKVTGLFLLTVTVQLYAVAMSIAAFLFMAAIGVPPVFSVVIPLIILCIVMVTTLFIIAALPKIPLNLDKIDSKSKIVSKFAHLYLD